ncbi:MAG: hypothetical protein ACREUW_12920 [Burkholderiales bacterium]
MARLRDLSERLAAALAAMWSPPPPVRLGSDDPPNRRHRPMRLAQPVRRRSGGPRE